MVATRQQNALDLLHKHDVDYPSWLKPLPYFLEELEKDMVELIVENGTLYRDSWGVWMHIMISQWSIDDLFLSFELFEHSRKFPASILHPNGFVDIRNKNPDFPKSKDLGSTETRQRGQTWQQTCMNLLKDEAKFLCPSGNRLFRRPGGVREVVKDSTAYQGLKNRMRIMCFDYQANHEDIGEAMIFDGKTIVSKDELNIETYMVYREV